MEDYKIDEHKLMYHPQRVSEWLKTGDCYPIYMEVSSSGRCNHRCIFCALDYIGYKNPFLDSDLLITRLGELSYLGLKAIMLAGEGEPLLHPEIVKIVKKAKELGLDVSITTNGVFLDKIFDVLDKLSWIRVSLDAGSANTYSEIHGCAPTDFSKVISNLETLVKLKKANNLECTIGTQVLLLEKNYQEVTALTMLLGDMGVDYLSVKPFSLHPLSTSRVVPVTSETALIALEQNIKTMESVVRAGGNKDFQATLRWRAFSRVGRPRTYRKCLGSSFFCHLSSLGEIHSCSTFLGKPELAFGNIHDSTFRDIWTSIARKKAMDSVDITNCRENCRLDTINQYLWELVHPSTHVNFI